MHPQLVRDAARCASASSRRRASARASRAITSSRSSPRASTTATGMPVARRWSCSRARTSPTPLEQRGRAAAGRGRARSSRSSATRSAAAHAAGIVHRDLKPENIFLARVAARGRAPSRSRCSTSASRRSSPRRRRTGDRGASGTPLWMAPEQTEPSGRHRAADGRVGARAHRVPHAHRARLLGARATREGANTAMLLREIVLEPVVAGVGAGPAARRSAPAAARFRRLVRALREPRGGDALRQRGGGAGGARRHAGPVFARDPVLPARTPYEPPPAPGWSSPLGAAPTPMSAAVTAPGAPLIPGRRGRDRRRRRS